MKYDLKKILASALCIVALCCGASFAQSGSLPSAASSGAGSKSASAEASQSTGIYTPLFLGGKLAFGSGTGVGTERGLGLREIEPMFGLWFPHVAFFRAGYGFYDFNGESDDEEIEIEHTNLNVELGVHIIGDVYVMGDFSVRHIGAVETLERDAKRFNGSFAIAPSAEDASTGRRMEAWTTEKGMQFYSGFALNDSLKDQFGRPLFPLAAFAFETQAHPDSVNKPDWPDTVLRPGSVFKSTTEYRFGILP